jgi:hypothetical protein
MQSHEEREMLIFVKSSQGIRTLKSSGYNGAPFLHIAKKVILRGSLVKRCRALSLCFHEPSGSMGDRNPGRVRPSRGLRRPVRLDNSERRRCAPRVAGPTM